MSDPVLSGYKWDHLNVSVSFMPDGTSCFGFGSRLWTLYKDMRWMPEFLHALQCWQDACGLTFTFSLDDGSPDNIGKPPGCGDIRFGASLGISGLGHAVFPDSSPMGGNITLNGTAPLNIGSNPDLFSVVLHELGPALGMSEGQPEESVCNGAGPYTGLFPIDVAGAQAMYGPPPVPDNRPRLWTPPPPPPPVLPTAPGGTRSRMSHCLLISWLAIEGCTYQVERMVGGVWQVMGTVKSNWYADGQMGDLHPAATYHVRAINAAGMGPPVEIKV